MNGYTLDYIIYRNAFFLVNIMTIALFYACYKTLFKATLVMTK